MLRISFRTLRVSSNFQERREDGHAGVRRHRYSASATAFWHQANVAGHGPGQVLTDCRDARRRCKCIQRTNFRHPQGVPKIHCYFVSWRASVGGRNFGNCGGRCGVPERRRHPRCVPIPLSKTTTAERRVPGIQKTLNFDTKAQNDACHGLHWHVASPEAARQEGLASRRRHKSLRRFREDFDCAKACGETARSEGGARTATDTISGPEMAISCACASPTFKCSARCKIKRAVAQEGASCGHQRLSSRRVL
ncbi:hypothetical protein GGX14DRAFT_694733, partial [Mycena pura]